MQFEPGTVIAGKYRVERPIGEGGMGVVLAVRHLGLDEMVAVKLIRKERGLGAAALARFQREARAAARLKSEHVARVLDVDRLPDGSPYIVMELIDGTDLHALMKRRGALPAEEAVTYITQACEGLAEAHALGMVHRDLKLKNLFLTKRRDGRALIKVIDFGVVKFSQLGDDDDPSGDGSAGAPAKAREATLTDAESLVGSIHYMAPEQIRASSVVTAQADVWSLGVCLYAMLTDSLPFNGDGVADVCAAIQGRTPRDVRELAPDVPPEVAIAVTRALEKDMRRRFGDVAEFATAIAPYGFEHGAPARIDTILRSDIRPRASTAPAARPEDASTLTSDPRRALESPAVVEGEAERGATSLDRVRPGEAETRATTLDAYASGARASVPKPSIPARRSRWISGLVIALLLGGVAVVVRKPAVIVPSPTRDEPAPTGARPEASGSTVAPPAASTEPGLRQPSVESVVGSAATSPAPRTTALGPPITAPRAARVPGPLPPASVKRALPPKPEPTSAYDHF